ncbi:MAG TPA: tRNA guanosine(15) transglycosylase TgtA [Methanobacterium sp.]|nr:MAG: tRNA guanosine(15) transglycosylase TgtA [Methanobacterium sp.]HOI71144.1 tRNA guanosine(15) transglycosylase TgtA [Methanobacterium sp.]
MNFEIKHKDARGRTGILKTPHGKVQTPALMPVIHPGKQTLDVSKYGADMVITNAYLIYKNQDLKHEALEKGVHELINFNGPVMTDSGSFQLSIYGDIEVSNQEIIEFQEKIGTDIGTSLDIPTPPFVTLQRAEREMEVTIQRAREALEFRDKLMLNSVVQGSTYPQLRSKCAELLGRMDFQLHPIGAVVPLMESYQYSTLLDVVMASVEHLPDSRPRHLMGAGHPMLFSFAVALGCDLFDSAAYILYAQDDRLLMPEGTYKLENLVEMPCSCPVCTGYSPDDLRQMKKDDRAKLLAQHNLYVSFAEMRQIRQALADGSLWELMERRGRNHPYLLDAVRKLKNYTPELETYDPPYKKSAFFYSGPESLNRPEVYRHLMRLERLPKKGRLLIFPPTEKPYHKHVNTDEDVFFSNMENPDLSKTDDLQIAVADVPFVLVPLEIDDVYPLAQNESPQTTDQDARKFLEKHLKTIINTYNDVIISKKVLDALDLQLETLGVPYKIPNQIPPAAQIISDHQKVDYIADYQFGSGSGKALFQGDANIIKSKKTGKIRHIYSNHDLIATLRARDGVLVLGMEGARRLHQYLPYPVNRVVVNEDAEPFAREGKSIFAKFIIDCDMNIRASEEVLVVNQQDELLAFGKSILNAEEFRSFNTGQAVKTRKGGF